MITLHYAFSPFIIIYCVGKYQPAYLVSTPIPHGDKGRSDEDSRPGKVRADWIPQDVEGIGAWQSARANGRVHQTVAAAIVVCDAAICGVR